MTPEKLAKIRALAEDARGDPATRMIARKILERYQAEPTFHDVDPVNKYFHGDPRNQPGMRNSEDYERHTFMSLHNWGKSKSTDNLVHTFTYKGRAYRVVLFKFKRSPTYGWLRVDVARNVEVWSSRFADLGSAHRDAWENLTKI